MSMYELLEDKIYRLENKYYKLLVDISSNKNLKQILLKLANVEYSSVAYVKHCYW